jgi:hypothetical protein
MLSSNRTLQLGTSGVPVLSVFTTQNVAIGTTTDSGFKLDVNGTAISRGNLTVGNAGSGVRYDLTFNASFPGAGTRGGIVWNSGASILNRRKFSGGNDNTISFLVANNTVELLTIQEHDGTVTTRNIGINNTSPNVSAILDITSSTKGFLQPRMTTVQKVAISTPATGLTVYDTTLNTNEYYDGAAWRSIASQAWVQSQGYLTGFTEGDTLQIVSDRGRVTTSLSSTGTTLVASATTGYTGVFFNYTLGNGTSYRAGTVTSVVSSGSTVEFTETSTNDIGNTSPVSLSVGVSGGFINLSATTTTTGWTIKVVPQGI